METPRNTDTCLFRTLVYKGGNPTQLQHNHHNTTTDVNNYSARYITTSSVL